MSNLTPKVKDWGVEGPGPIHRCRVEVVNFMISAPPGLHFAEYERGYLDIVAYDDQWYALVLDEKSGRLVRAVDIEGFIAAGLREEEGTSPGE